MIARPSGFDTYSRSTGWLKKPFVQTVFWLAVCGYAVIAILSLFGSAVNEFDEAIPLVGGMLVRRGLTPNVDFYSVYAPLGMYVNAFAFGLFGRTVIATRLISAGLYLLVLFLATRFLHRQFPYSAQLIPVVALLFAIGIGGALGQPVWQGFAISLAAFLVYLSPELAAKPRTERNRLVGVAVSGVLTGVALLYRLNFGGYVAAVVFIDLFLRRQTRGGRLRLNPDFQAMAAFGIPLIACCLGFYLPVYRTEVFAIFRQLLAAGAHGIAVRFITLGLSSQLFLALMLPFLWYSVRILRSKDHPRKALAAAAFALAFPVVALAGRNHASITYILVLGELAAVISLHFFVRRLEQFELAILLFYCCVLHYYLSRVDWPHWVVMPAVMALLLPSLALRTEATPEPSSKPAFPRSEALVLLATAVFIMAQMSSAGIGVVEAKLGIHILASLANNAGKSDTDLVADEVIPPVPEWAALYPDENELQAVRYLRGRTGSHDPIFVGYGDHSRIYFGNLQFYWLADRPIGVRTFEMETGWATEAGVQQEIISDLKTNHVQWLVIDRAEQHGDRTFERRAYRGSSLLDEYIRDNFREQARFGPYAILAAR